MQEVAPARELEAIDFDAKFEMDSSLSLPSKYFTGRHAVNVPVELEKSVLSTRGRTYDQIRSFALNPPPLSSAIFRP